MWMDIILLGYVFRFASNDLPIEIFLGKFCAQINLEYQNLV